MKEPPPPHLYTGHAIRGDAIDAFRQFVTYSVRIKGVTEPVATDDTPVTRQVENSFGFYDVTIPA